ncbi:MAG: hypothetical protein LBC99_03260 [Spirochaetota bacterium]|jgi:hypothetical protein|nr:hypothetical protein [Spirochaetota bacterium]
MKIVHIVCALALLAAACGGAGDDDPLYANVAGSKLRLNNGSDQDLLLYKEAPKGNTPFAGVRAAQQGWGAANAASGLWVLYVVAQAEYDARPANPKVAMSLMVFVDSNAATYDIGSSATGGVPLVIRNTSLNYVEVHTETFTGPLFLTVRPWEFGSTKYVPQGSYTFFPIVKVEQKQGVQTVAILSRFFLDGRRTFGLYSDNLVILDVTPGGEIGETRNIECLIYIQNNYNNNGGGSYVHQGGRNGPLVKSTLGREIANLNQRFDISWRPELDETTGAPLSQNFNAVFVLENVQGVSQSCNISCVIGNAYWITCGANGAWGEVVTAPIS